MRVAFNRLHAWLYRRTGGRALGRIGGQPVLLLSTTGRRSGQTRTTPVQYLRHGKAWVIVATNGGAPLSTQVAFALLGGPGSRRRRLRLSGAATRLSRVPGAHPA